ncbi:MAG: hypothetical protein AAGA88_01090 [Pseudomonadota bacterium]
MERLDDATLAGMHTHEIRERLATLMPPYPDPSLTPDLSVEQKHDQAFQNMHEFLKLGNEVLRRDPPHQSPDETAGLTCFRILIAMQRGIGTRRGMVFEKDIDQLVVRAMQESLVHDELRHGLMGLSPWRPHISLETYPLPEMPETAIRRQILSMPNRLIVALEVAEADESYPLHSDDFDVLRCLADATSRDHLLLFYLAGAKKEFPMDRPSREGLIASEADLKTANSSELSGSNGQQGLPAQDKSFEGAKTDVPLKICSRSHLFSDAIAQKIREYRANNSRCPNARNLELRRHMFIAVMGDLPISDIDRLVFGEFMSKISYLPAEIARTGEWKSANLTEILRCNGMPNAIGEPCGPITKSTISQKTITDKIGRPLLSALNTYRTDHNLGERIAYRFNALSAHTPRTRSRRSAAGASVRSILKAGVDDGRLLQAMLPLLLITTGRRLGQLAVMHGSDVSFQHGQWFAQIPHQRFHSEGLIVHHDKNELASDAFVLHPILDEIGYIDFIKGNGDGPVFKSLFLSSISNIENAAQKRIGRLINGVGTSDVAHQFRHSYIRARDRMGGLQEKFAAMQTGHAASSEGQRYAREWDAENAARIASVDLSDYVDVTIYRGFDFERAQNLCLAKAKRYARTRER